ncbi:MAG: nuclear transport factor 2 family protein [Porphyrobacter sp.]|nr:nuclear transport factor 2 family protein [Porphyrobacter sp.]
MDRARYERYIAAFNGKDYDALGEFYAGDVEFVLSEERGLRFHGRDAILDLYRPFHRAVDEHVEIVRFADGGDFLVVEVNAEFRPIAGKTGRDRLAARQSAQGHHLRVLRSRPGRPLHAHPGRQLFTALRRHLGRGSWGELPDGSSRRRRCWRQPWRKRATRRSCRSPTR